MLTQIMYLVKLRQELPRNKFLAQKCNYLRQPSFGCDSDKFCETLRHSLHHISLNLNHTNSSIVAMPTLSSSPFLSLRRPHAEAVLFPFTTSTFTAPVNYTVADRGRGDSLFV
uniref:Uncharacterized protein n=1 Tax=Caenorhabditis japonica TaxID=281687 RepID=A0A8R1IF77_CAEJA